MKLNNRLLGILPSPLDPTDLNSKLIKLASRISNCSSCRLSQTRTLTVPGDGDPSSGIMFIGEGPGYNEDQRGVPFIGRAGNLLEQLLQSIGLTRKKVFITNMVKCRPPDNRDPHYDELNSCSGYLDDQILAIDPAVIVTLGRFSFGKFFPGIPLSKARGVPRRWKECNVFPMYHPAAALYNPGLLPRLEQDFRRLPDLVLGFKRERESDVSEVVSMEEKQLGLFD